MTQHGATLNGSFNTKGWDSTVYFNYGLDTNLGTIVQVTGVFNSDTDTEIPVSVDITGLFPSTTYYFQLGLTYEGGTILGEILSFTTPVEVPIVTTLEATNIF